MAVASVGVSFKRGDGASSETFTAIAEITSISGPNMSRETIDTTSLDTSGGYRTFLASFRDGGEITLNMNFTRDGYIAMKTDFETDTTVNYQIVCSDTGATTMDFAGLCTGLGFEASTDDVIKANTTIKVSGAVTVSS